MKSNTKRYKMVYDKIVSDYIPYFVIKFWNKYLFLNLFKYSLSRQKDLNMYDKLYKRLKQEGKI